MTKRESPNATIGTITKFAASSTPRNRPSRSAVRTRVNGTARKVAYSSTAMTGEVPASRTRAPGIADPAAKATAIVAT